MAETTGTALRRLPSADWVAFGIGLTGMALQYLWPPLLGVVLLAVILPSVLRETGLLKDADEFTRGVMHRAGFHALLVVTTLTALNFVLVAVGLFDPRARNFSTEPFGGETLRKALVWVFLISYLIQYWGARGGVVRVLLGVALMMLTPLLTLLRPGGYPWPGAIVAATGGTAAAMVGLALLVRRWPRAGGGTLLAIFAAATLVIGRDLADPRLVEAGADWALLSVLFQAALIFGVTGVALLRETRNEEAEP